MPRRASDLPRPFDRQPFSVARGTDAGISRRRTRAQDLVIPFYGVRSHLADFDISERCRARATRLPDYAIFSHTTAARLHSQPLPLRYRNEEILHITVPQGHRAPEGRSTRGHQAMIDPARVVTWAGMRITDPVRTFCDLAPMLTLPQLVAVGDHLIRRGVHSYPRHVVEAVVAAHPGRRHRRRLARAVELLDEDAESPKESELRTLIVEAGFPRPVCNEPVFDAGRFVARVDLAYPERKIAIEYEGDHHRDKDQWRKDLARRRRLEALGWVYLSVTQADLDDPRALLADLRAALAR